MHFISPIEPWSSAICPIPLSYIGMKLIYFFCLVFYSYTVATGTKDDRSFLRKLNCNYVVLDEGHMLKNMQSQRYQGLMKMKVGTLLLCGKVLHQPRLRSKVNSRAYAHLSIPCFSSPRKRKTKKVTEHLIL